MPFPSSAVGLELAPRAKTVTTRDLLAYSAGLGAVEPPFLDDLQSGGLRALPFYCVSLEWPVVLSLRERLAAELTAVESRRGVHAVQDSIFHRPIRPGDQLSTTGCLVSAREIRAGVLTTLQLETREAETGDLVTTSWSSSVYRDVVLAGEPVSLAAAPGLPVAGTLELDETVTIPIPREAPHVYSECADIWNPIHTERAEALAAGLPDIILHGTATWAHAGVTMLRRYGASDVARLRRFSGRFSGMVIPGETIRVRHAPSPTDPAVIGFDVLGASGASALSQGVALFTPAAGSTARSADMAA